MPPGIPSFSTSGLNLNDSQRFEPSANLSKWNALAAHRLAEIRDSQFASSVPWCPPHDVPWFRKWFSYVNGNFKIWPYMVQYLQFRILKWPLIMSKIQLRGIPSAIWCHLILEPPGPEMDRCVGSSHRWITGYWPGGHGGSRRLGFHRKQHFCSWIFLPQKMILDDSRWIAIDQASFQTNPARFRSMFQPKPTPVQGVEKDTNDEYLMLHSRVEVCSPAVWQAQAWGTLNWAFLYTKLGLIQTINPQSFRYTAIQSLEPRACPTHWRLSNKPMMFQEKAT
jgi:hypothetical protein